MVEHPELDPPAVESPPRRPMSPFLSWLHMNGVSTLVLIGAVAAFFDLKGDVKVLSSKVDDLKGRMDRAGVGAPRIEGEPESSAPIPTMSARKLDLSPSGVTSMQRAAPTAAPRTGMATLPEDAESEPPPVCVFRRTYRQVSCDSAGLRCWKERNFKPELLAELREKFGTHDIRICGDERSPP